MASAIGMAIRANKANERIDAALNELASRLDVPAKPTRERDPLYSDVLRLEWLADTLETLAKTPEGETE